MLPESHLRFVLATSTSKAEITFDRSALEGAKQLPNFGPSRSITVHFVFRKQGWKCNYLRRDETLGGDHAVHIQSDGNARQIFV